MNLKLHKLLSFATRLLPNKKAFCFRCGITDAFAEFHAALVRQRIFSPCNHCFGLLQAKERVEFYYGLIKHYKKHDQPVRENEIELIDEAVLRGD